MVGTREDQETINRCILSYSVDHASWIGIIYSSIINVEHNAIIDVEWHKGNSTKTWRGTLLWLDGLVKSERGLK